MSTGKRSSPFLLITFDVGAVEVCFLADVNSFEMASEENDYEADK